MKKIIALLSVFAIVANIQALDFIKNEIHYRVLTESTVAVAGLVSSSDGGSSIFIPVTNGPKKVMASSDMTVQIPASVQYDGRTYSVVEIEENAFLNQSTITRFDIPASISQIGDAAFAGCTSLKSIHCKSKSPAVASSNTFASVSRSGCVIYIPWRCRPAYENATGWGSFQNIFEVGYQITYKVDGAIYAKDSLAEGDAIILRDEPTKEEYQFCGWKDYPENLIMPTQDIIINGSFESVHYVLNDGQTYTKEADAQYKTVTYHRTFNSTEWEAAYLPFDWNYEDWKDEYEVARINAFHQYDDDEDGVFEKNELEAIKVKSGTMKHHVPFLIRAIQPGEKSVVLNDATVYRSSQESIDCSSVFTQYTFTGNYSNCTRADLSDETVYLLNSGAMVKTDTDTAISPFRWYMSVETTNPQLVSLAPTIRLRVLEYEGESTAIKTIYIGENPIDADFYLNGTMCSPHKGLVIHRGKVIYLK